MAIEQKATIGDPQEASASAAPLRPVRWLAVFAVALPLIVLNTGWIANSEMKTGVTELTISTLFLGVTFILFVLTLLNLACRALFGPRRALNQAELMALYVLLSISSAVAGVGNLGFFTPFLANPFYFNTPANGWETFWHLLPPYVGPRDPAILKGFFLGHSTAFQVPILRAWAYPLSVWGLFLLALLWTTLCLSAILWRRWDDEEHLPFPVIALPLEMTREGAPLYRHKLLWAGFALPLLLHSLNSLHSVVPTLPTLPINSAHDLVYDDGLSFPWNGAGSFFNMQHPAGVGFGYLINTDVSFSLWFFYLLKKAVDVWAAATSLREPATGWYVDSNGQFPYFSYQGWGAWLALSLGTLYAGRRYFKDTLGRAFLGDKRGRDRNEPMSARLAVFGFLAGFLTLCAFVWQLGGSWWLPPLFLAVYLLFMVTLSRIRAETAVLCSELVWINPQSLITSALGTSHLSRADLAHVSLLSWFNSDYRAAPMPHQLEGFVGLGRAGGRTSPLVGAILLAAAVAIVSALLWDLQLYYVHGAATGNVNGWRISKGYEPWSSLQNWLNNPKPPDHSVFGGVAAGAAVTLLLSALRARFVGFPLSPAAYALNMSFANDFFWGDMLLAWALKVCILRYGGVKAYRQGLPFFLGLILGDYVTGAVWSLIGMAFHLNLFRTFAN